jgi:hypothetical protein
MTITTIIMAIWLGGWLISAAAYLRSSIKRAQMTGVPWSPAEHLASISAIFLTWLPSLIIYIVALVNHRSRST